MDSLTFDHTVHLSYKISGAGDTCWLLCNGASLPLEIWDPLAENLAQDSKVVQFDQRDSGRTHASGSFTLLDIAADAMKLLDHLDVEQAIVVGHAWGGRVAQVAARDYPHRVRGLAICGTGGKFPGQVDPALQSALADALSSRSRHEWDAALEAMYFAPGYRERQPQDFASISNLLWDPANVPHATWDRQVAPSSSYWGSTRVPTMLIYGAEDRFGTPQHGEDLARSIPGAKLALIESAGHMLIREAKDQCLEILRRFATSLA